MTDQTTGKPVPYANIWVENENLGTTSDEAGKFSLSNAATGKTLVVSCLGYDRAKVDAHAGVMTVKLVPVQTTLKEVVVKKNMPRDKKIINKLSDRTEFAFSSNGTPWIVAQYIPYQPSFSATPFLDEIALVTLSNIKKAKFKVHLYKVGEDGAPGADLLPVPLVVEAGKGVQKVAVDVSLYDVQIPKTGVFIAFEWLILKQNIYEKEDSETGQKIKGSVAYEPSIRTYGPSSQKRNGWIYDQGRWRSTDEKDGDGITQASPHFQLTLSN
ncbi:carboxypeptidase-like regulatory domain-containing protein [Nibribacter koreensis]|uniref:Carboxypeptidase-like regulatory domain-containing protein n=1 Tax=Nibribacter koreensis TaxID=1084519 RepID=A0ABP8FNS8_9BACT